MVDVAGEGEEPFRVAFDRRIKLEFHGARITSDGMAATSSSSSPRSLCQGRSLPRSCGGGTRMTGVSVILGEIGATWAAIAGLAPRGRDWRRRDGSTSDAERRAGELLAVSEKNPGSR
jgi:hypothetical protein